MTTSTDAFPPRSEIGGRARNPTRISSSSLHFTKVMGLTMRKGDSATATERPTTVDAGSTAIRDSHPSEKDEVMVHVSSEQSDLQEDLNNISSLRDLFVKQSQTLAMFDSEDYSDTHVGSSISSKESPARSTRTNEETTVSLGSSGLAMAKSFEETLDAVTELLERSFDNEVKNAVSPTSVTDAEILDESHSFAGVERMLDFEEESEDIDSTRLSSIDGSDSAIQAAIDAIRKEASQMDIIMALDSLKTIEAELMVTSRALHERSLEAEDLRSQLEQKQEIIAGIELERDLYQADASKLKDDLKTCVDRMFDISAVAGNSFLPEESQTSKLATDRGDQAIFRPPSSPEDSSIPPIPQAAHLSQSTSTSGRTMPMSEFSSPEAPRRRISIRRKPSKSDPSTSASFRTRESVVADAFPFPGSSYSRHIFRRNSERAKPDSPAKTLSTQSISIKSPPLDPSRRRRSFSDVISSPPRAQIDVDNEASVERKRMCGLFRRRSSKRSIARAQEVATMRKKIDQLHTMMTASLETSEKLRKRLAMISRYYEGIIKKAQQQMIEIKTEKSKMKTDFESKLALLDHSKRVVVKDLEMQLQQRNEEIKRLKEQI